MLAATLAALALGCGGGRSAPRPELAPAPPKPAVPPEQGCAEGDLAACNTLGERALAGPEATHDRRRAREMFEREYLLTQINRFGGNISRTANFVGMERSALHRKLKSLGVVTGSKNGGRGAHFEDEEEEV